jgi:hypothetical protein
MNAAAIVIKGMVVPDDWSVTTVRNINSMFIFTV